MTRVEPTPPSARVRLDFRPARPYSLARTIARLGRFPEVVDRIEDGRYRRLLLVEDRPLLLSVEQLGPPSGARLRILLEGPGARRSAARRAALEVVERALGARTDLKGFYRAFGQDPLLGGAIRSARGLCVLGWPTVWEALVTAVFSQQVNLAFAYSIRRELALRFGRRARLGDRTWVAFPTPERIARVPEPRLRELRLSEAKAQTLLRLARAFRGGELAESELRALPDEAVVSRLTALKGIGRWTADTALMRGLGRVDAFPAGDLGVVKYLARGLLGHARNRSEQEMRRFAERWRPYRALALTYAYAELARRRS